MTTGFAWLQVVAISVGAALGALLRWACGLWFTRPTQAFPIGTLVVNCVGGFLIGMALAWFDRHPNELMRLLLVTGFLGGLTTFSAFSGESLLLIQRNEWGSAFGHTLAHVLGSLACAALGFRLARQLLA